MCFACDKAKYKLTVSKLNIVKFYKITNELTHVFLKYWTKSNFSSLVTQPNSGYQYQNSESLDEIINNPQKYKSDVAKLIWCDIYNLKFLMRVLVYVHESLRLIVLIAIYDWSLNKSESFRWRVCSFEIECNQLVPYYFLLQNRILYPRFWISVSFNQNLCSTSHRSWRISCSHKQTGPRANRWKFASFSLLSICCPCCNLLSCLHFSHKVLHTFFFDLFIVSFTSDLLINMQSANHEALFCSIKSSKMATLGHYWWSSRGNKLKQIENDNNLMHQFVKKSYLPVLIPAVWSALSWPPRPAELTFWTRKIK